MAIPKDLAEAGHYTRDEALKICREAIFTASDIGQIAELPVRFTDIAEFLHRAAYMPKAITKDRDFLNKMQK